MATEVQNTNDTRGQTGTGWYGFDLDGTLAVYKGWLGINRIGAPVGPMVDRIMELRKEGKVVKIVTARVAPKATAETKPNPYGDAYQKEFTECDPRLKTVKRCPWLTKSEWTAIDFVRDWCDDNLGFIPEITHEKDSLMLELYDDRVKQVFPNEGTLVEDVLSDVRKECKKWNDRYVDASRDLSDAKDDYYRLLLNDRRIFWRFLISAVVLANMLAAVINVTNMLIAK